MEATPSGGRPAAIARRSAKAARCSPMRSSLAVQEARNSRSSVLPGPAISPNLVEDVDVTVPPRAVKEAPESSRQSVSQLQATSGSDGSRAISSSTSAVRKMTMRSVPSHASTPSGSCRSIKRPEADSGRSPAHITSAESAWLHGASLVGAGSSPSSISGLILTRARSSRAAWNAAGAMGSADVVMSGDTTAAHRQSIVSHAARRENVTRTVTWVEQQQSPGGWCTSVGDPADPTYWAVGARRSDTELMHHRSSVGVW